MLVPEGIVPRVVLRLVRVERGSRERVAAFPVLRARIAHLLVRHRGDARVLVIKTKPPLAAKARFTF